MKHERFKADAQVLEPTAVCTATWTRRRCVYHVTLGNRTLGKGISPTVAWKLALAKMWSEIAIDHLNGDCTNNDIANLRVVRISENIGGSA